MIVDLSKHQGTVDFNKLKAKTGGVMIRCAYGTSKDIKFDENVNGAKSAGIPYGAYVFATWHYSSKASTAEASKKLALEQASKIIEYLSKKNITGYTALDMELENGQSTALSKEEMTDIANTYMDNLQAAGLRPVLYCSISWLYDCMLPDKLRFPFWIAYYHTDGFNSDAFPDTKYGKLMSGIKDRIVLWQFSSKGEGSDYGVESEYIDLNHLYGDFSKLSNTAASEAQESAVQQPSVPAADVNPYETYIVQKGDTMIRIARNYDLTLEALKRANPQVTNVNLIMVGQKINIPKTIIATSAAVTAESSDALKAGDRVKVKSGARTYAGGKIAGFVFEKSYMIDELKNDRAVLNKAGICTPVNIKDLIKVG